MQGVLIAQLFRLQKSESSVDRLRFYQVGIPLSVACHCVAVLVATIGAYRFWRQQGAISRGKVHAGGWELNWVGILLFAVSSAPVDLAQVHMAHSALDHSCDIDHLRRDHRRDRNNTDHADPTNAVALSFAEALPKHQQIPPIVF